MVPQYLIDRLDTDHEKLERIKRQDVKRGDLAIFEDGSVGAFLDSTKRFNNPNLITNTFFAKGGARIRNDLESLRRAHGKEVVFKRYEDHQPEA